MERVRIRMKTHETTTQTQVQQHNRGVFRMCTYQKMGIPSLNRKIPSLGKAEQLI